MATIKELEAQLAAKRLEKARLEADVNNLTMQRDQLQGTLNAKRNEAANLDNEKKRLEAELRGITG